MIETAFSSIGAIELVAMLICGLLAGTLLMWVLPDGPHTLESIVVLIGTLGLGFFISRGVALFVDGNPLWPRNVGFAILWLVYTLAIAGGVLLRHRAGEDAA